MPFQIIRNDITKLKADAIVNTANPKPRVGSGTDRAIHEAAGPELLAARREIGKIAVGQSAATPAFGLPAKYVLHTVSPAWKGGQNGEQALLRRAYDSALALAEKLGCESVAFPLMAAGIYAFPHDIALSVAINAFTEFLFEHRMQIFLVLFNAEAFEIAGTLFDDLQSFIDDRYVSERAEWEYGVDAETGILPPEYHIQKAPSGGKNRAKLRRPSHHGEYLQSLPCGASEAASAPAASGPDPDTLEDILRRQHESTFSEYLLSLLMERDCKYSEVYKRAEISKALFSKILNNKDYQPKKDTAVQLAIGLQLDMPQTQKLLEKAGYTLTRGSKADLVVEYCIRRKYYSIAFINGLLDDCGLPLLKTGLKA